MKGIILEITDGHSIIIGRSGEMRKIKAKPGHKVGEEIVVSSALQGKTSVFSSVLAAAISLVVLTGWFLPGSYVYVDVNPSIELTLNNFDRVIRAQGLNEDGTDLLRGLDITGEKVDGALTEIAEEAVALNYFENPENANFAVSILSNNAGKAHNLALQGSALLESFFAENVQLEINVSMNVDTVSLRDQAAQLGITPGKLSLIQQLMAANPEISYSERQNASVQEILTELQGLKQGTADSPAHEISDPGQETQADTRSEGSQGSPAHENSGQGQVNSPNPNREESQGSPAHENSGQGQVNSPNSNREESQGSPAHENSGQGQENRPNPNSEEPQGNGPAERGEKDKEKPSKKPSSNGKSAEDSTGDQDGVTTAKKQPLSQMPEGMLDSLVEHRRNNQGNGPDANNGNSEKGNGPDGNSGNSEKGNGPDGNNGNSEKGNGPDGNSEKGNGPDGNNGNSEKGNGPNSNSGNTENGNTGKGQEKNPGHSAD